MIDKVGQICGYDSDDR